MKLVTYSLAGQSPRFGVLRESSGNQDSGERIVDVGAASMAFRQARQRGEFLLPGTMVEYLQTGKPGRDLLDRVLAWVDETGYPTIALEQARLHAPIGNPPKLLALAGNYQEHIEEGGGTRVDKSTSVPNVFIKPATTLIGPEDPLTLPSHISSEVDWELEIAIVIGEPVYRASHEEALDAIAGYMVLNDISSRSLDISKRRRETTARDAFFDWLNGKWQDGFAPSGPWLATADSIPDPNALRMQLAVNGEVRQEGSTAQMIFDTGEIVEWVSQLCSLEPGDIIATGTPAGVGAVTRSFLKDGDVITAEIEALGRQTTPVQGNSAR